MISAGEYGKPLIGPNALAAWLAGLATGPGMPALFTARQRYTPPALYGQISTTGASLKLRAFALGAVVGGQLLPVIGAVAVFVLPAGSQLVGAALGAVAGRSSGGPSRPSRRMSTAASQGR